MKGYIKIRKRSLEILNSKLSKDLYYHSVNHTMNILKVANQYLRREKIYGDNAKLIRIGVLMHDIGFTVSNENHEQVGAEIAEKMMIEHGFSKRDIKVVNELILSTRIPQCPHNHFEKIICDADLDYLGRSDYYQISELLFKELKAYSLIDNKKEWNKAQIKFLEAHKYHTDFAQKNRQPNKEKRIKELKKLL